MLLVELEKVLNRPNFRASIDSVHIDALAKKADAQCIVSGDAHLTQLGDVSPPVLTPREFLQRRR